MCGIYALPKVLYILIVQMDLPTFIQKRKKCLFGSKITLFIFCYAYSAAYQNTLKSNFTSKLIQFYAMYSLNNEIKFVLQEVLLDNLQYKRINYQFLYKLKI